MRLDHLLSRDLGACEGAGGARGRVPWVLSWPVGGPDEQHGNTLLGLCLLVPVCGCRWVGVGGARLSCCGGGGGMLSGSGAACPLCPASASPCCAAAVLWWWCGGLWGCGWVGCELYSGREYLCSLWCVFVVCLASWSCCAVRGVVGSGRGLPVLCVVFMGVRWMPWHQGPMKDVVDCDKPRGAVLRALIRGFPNGGTRRPSWGVTRV